MSKKTKKKAGFPMFPGMMFPMPDASDWDWNWNKSDMKSFWEKNIEQQKSSKDASKNQFDQSFEYFQDMLDSFAETLPEELPWMPSWAKSPTSFRKTMKEWEEMANEYFVEQADLWTDFFIKSQEKACAQIPEATEEDAEEQEDAVEVKAEVVEKPKQAKPAASKTTAAKTATAKATAAKETPAKAAAAKETPAKETK